MDTGLDDAARRARLLDAEQQAIALLDAIEHDGLLAAGRSEREIERDIYRLARERFGIRRHWHERIVRSGPNTVSIAGDSPPIRTVDADDILFLDLGPVLGAWEADVGRSFVIGTDPQKHALVRDLPLQFDAIRQHYLDDATITGAGLYAFACRTAQAAGWRFGGRIAGHLVAEFPHVRLYTDAHSGHIRPENCRPMREPDHHGRERFWIIEVHLLEPEGRWGGFYERLLVP